MQNAAMVGRRFRFPYPGIQAAIVSLFVIIFVAYAAVSGIYTYQRSKAAMLQFMQQLMAEVDLGVADHMDGLFSRMDDLASVQTLLIRDVQSISLENAQLRDYFVRALTRNPDVSSVHCVAANTGSGLWAMHVPSNATYRNTPTQPLPATVRFAIESIDRSSTPAKERWVYLDQQGKVVETEDFVPAQDFDPRQRSWFKGVNASGKPFWTQLYVFHIANEPGLTVSYPVLDSRGQIIAVTAADATIQSISSYLAQQQVGEHGIALILTAAGGVVAAPNYQLHPEDEVEQAHLMPVATYNAPIGAAFETYITKKTPIVTAKYNGVDYAASFAPYKAPSGGQWLITTVAPQKDFLGALIEAQQRELLLKLLLLLVAVVTGVLFARHLARPIRALSTEVEHIKHLDLEERPPVRARIKEIIQMGLAVEAMKSVLKSFGRYVPMDIVSRLMEQGKEVTLGGERKEMTLFFSDIYDFTNAAETLPLDQLNRMLLPYFEIFSTAILEQNGTIDKYIGDSVMAFWNAPHTVPDHAFNACRAALLIQRALGALNAQWAHQGLPTFETRIGIHTGTAAVGNIGTRQRMNYTVLGDAVNLASRLEGTNKAYHTNIMISEQTANHLNNRFLLRPLDVVLVKGRTEPVTIYELLAQHSDPDLAPTPDQLDLANLFTQAYTHYREQQRKEALELFTTIAQRWPADHPTHIYLERLAQGGSIEPIHLSK